MHDFESIFGRLREAMLAGAAGLPIARDEPGNLIVHARNTHTKTGAPEWFGAVMIKRSYVAYHLIPLYTDPARCARLSVALSKRRQGKSCFNFKKLDDDLFAELAALTADLAQP